MSDEATNLPILDYRAGRDTDWPLIAEMVSDTWESGDYIGENTWAAWAADSTGYLVVASLAGEVVGFGHLGKLGEAEWWLEGIRIAKPHQRKSYGRALLAYMIALFKQHGLGLLRFVTSADNLPMHLISRDAGFKHLGSYGPMTSDPAPGEYRNFKVLQSQNLRMIQDYLKRSLMFRVNQFAERDWEFQFLTEERLVDYLADEQVEFVGWRHKNQLNGLVILFTDPPEPDEGNPMKLGYVDAADDTTFRAMATGLQGLAQFRGYDRILWKTPLGVGLDRTLDRIGFERVGENDLWLFELPLR